MLTAIDCLLKPDKILRLEKTTRKANLVHHLLSHKPLKTQRS